ncbi:hypothetical protein BV20DRAFT_986825 [Pilatotrama ljubarskyi]|nr:hypothetical protein BV20DRAFT_986825 [Pilatotrama ljubarskyi]
MVQATRSNTAVPRRLFRSLAPSPGRLACQLEGLPDMMTRRLVVVSFVAAGVMSGQSTNAECRNNSGTAWWFNSLGQSPCLMAAYMQGACQPDGSAMVQALPDATFNYNGPSTETTDVCMCSSIAYALFSACGFCQGSGWPEWSQWTQYCNAQDVHNGRYV